MTVETVKEQGFTQEKLDAIGRGEVKITDLNETERGQLFEYQKTGQIEGEPVDDAVKNEPTTATPPEESSELKVIKQKLFDTQVDANRNGQLLKKSEEDKSFFKSQLDALNTATITKATGDHFDDDSQKNLRETVDLLKSQYAALLEYSQNNATANQQATQEVQQNIENQKGSLSIEQLQSSFPDLQTTKPIKQLGKELQNFSEAVGGMDNVNKYLDDPEYKKQIDEQGITPLSDSFIENLPKYNKIWDLNNKYAVVKDDNGQSYSARNPDVSIDNYYMNELQSTGKYTDMLSNAKLTGANSVADKVVSQKFTAATMTPSGGADILESGMTEAKIIEIQARIGPKIRANQKLTADEEKEFEVLRDFMKQQHTR